MNGLTLRVSSIRPNGNEVKKTNECKLDPIQLEIFEPAKSLGKLN